MLPALVRRFHQCNFAVISVAIGTFGDALFDITQHARTPFQKIASEKLVPDRMVFDSIKPDHLRFLLKDRLNKLSMESIPGQFLFGR